MAQLYDLQVATNATRSRENLLIGKDNKSDVIIIKIGGRSTSLNKVDNPHAFIATLSLIDAIQKDNKLDGNPHRYL